MDNVDKMVDMERREWVSTTIKRGVKNGKRKRKANRVKEDNSLIDINIWYVSR